METRRPINPEMARVGKKIVFIIALLHIFMSFGSFFINLYTYYFFLIAFGVFAFHIGIAIALIRGYMLIRYAFAFNAVMWAFNLGSVIFADDATLWLIILNTLLAIYAISISTILFFSKSVTEYMLDKNDGW